MPGATLSPRRERPRWKATERRRTRSTRTSITKQQRRLVLEPVLGWRVANNRIPKNSARGSRTLWKLTIISGLKLAREIMDTLAARQQMVDQQIRAWEVLDPRVLEALSAVPREAFVPAEYREL